MPKIKDSTKNLHTINEQTISNQSKICPICQSDKVKTFGMNARMKFDAVGFSGPFPTITYICTECGYLMFFKEVTIDLKEPSGAELL